MKLLQEEKQKKRRGGLKRAVGSLVIASLLVNPLSPIGSLFPKLTAEAASLPVDFKVPGAIGYPVLNKLFADNETYYRANRNEYNLGAKMTSVSMKNSVSGSRYWDDVISDIQLSGRGTWSAVYEYELSDTDTKGFSQELETKFGGHVTNYNSSHISLGNGVELSTYDKDGGSDFATDWMPWDGVSNPQAVVNGKGDTFIDYMYYIAADRYSPGEKGWEYEVEEEAETGKPILWLTCTDLLRPANSEITIGDLAKMKIKLGLIPADDPSADIIYCTAGVINVSDDLHSLGFRIADDEWESLKGKDYKIRSMEDASDKGYFTLEGYRYSVNTAVTDYVGNPVVFLKTDLTEEDLLIDVQAPSAAKVALKGKSVDATQNVTGEPEDFPDDLDTSSLYAGAKDTLSFDIHLSELVVPLSPSEMEMVSLEWNIKDASGNTVYTPLKYMGETLVGGENGQSGTVLSFGTVYITPGMSPQGTKIRPLRITNAHLLKDESTNAMAADGQAYEIALAPDKQNYLDSEGPNAAMRLTRSEVTADAAKYTIEMDIQDGTGDKTSAGILDKNASVALTSYSGAPGINYKYVVSQDADFPADDKLTGNGVLTAQGNPVYHQFKVVTGGKYYLHVKLTDVNDKELEDSKGMTVHCYLVDDKGNAAFRTFNTGSLELDFKAPKLTVNPFGITVDRATGEASQESANIAELTARIVTYELNGIDRVVYQWVDAGAAAAENEWQTAYQRNTAPDAEPAETVMELKVEEKVSSTGTVSRDVVVRAYDVHGNYEEKRLNMSADLTRAVPKYEVVGDFTIPSKDNDIVIYPPVSSAEGQEQSGWTRVMVDIGDGFKYIHIIQPGQSGVGALDISDTQNWYCVNATSTGYGTLWEETVLPAYYGELKVSIVSSFQDLTPKENSTINPADDTTRSDAVEFIIPYAPKTEGIYQASLTSVQNNAGEAQTKSRKNGIYYYKFDQSMTGTRFCYSLTNAKVSGWGVADVDFEKSYAVLLKADTQGKLVLKEDGSFDESCEVTERALLSSSAEQTYSVPGGDKSGSPFETGVYMLKVHVVQKAGAEQDFYFENDLLLLDATNVPERFGVLEYEVITEADGTIDYQNPLFTISAAEGKVLSNVNIGVAKPSSAEGELPVMTSYGFPAYALETQNGLSYSKNTAANAHVYIEAELPQTQQSYFVNESGKNGLELGTVKGMKFWNAASTGDPKELAYYGKFVSTGTPWMEERTENGKKYYALAIQGNMSWYTESEDCIIVSKEELAAKDLADFALTMGQNTICYQLQMSNGMESPVYQFEMNLCQETPTMKLSYEPAEWKPLKRYYDSDSYQVVKTEDIKKMYVSYINVTVDDAFSPNSNVRLFHAKINERGNGFDYEEIQVGQTVQFTKDSIGYLGSEGAEYDTYNGCRVQEYICAVDNAGNAVTAYPIQKRGNEGFDTGDYEIVYEIFDTNPGEYELFTAAWSAPDSGDFEEPDEALHRIVLNHDSFDDLDDSVEYLTVQLDGGEPVRINTRLSDTVNNDVLQEANGAGIVDFTEELYLGDYNYKDVVQFVLPYDPQKAEGEEISHKVTVTGYSWANEAAGLEQISKTMEFEVTGKNIKPAAAMKDPAFTDRAGEVQFTANTYVKPEGSDTYSNSFSRIIYESGRYRLHFMDKYAEEYVQPMDIPEKTADPKVTASATELTAGPVVITVSSENYLISLSDSTAASLPEGTLVEGTGSKELKLTFYKNTKTADSDGRIEVNYGVDGTGQALWIVVDNIVENAKAIDPIVQWSYSQYAVEEGNIVRGNVTAALVDQNGSRLVDPLTNKAPSYVFTPGGVTSYTFTGYENVYGVKGTDIVATLPVTLLPVETDDQENDVYQPDIALTGYAIRDDISTEINAAYVKKNTRPEGSKVTRVDYAPTAKFGEENVFTDIKDFLYKLSWADSYLLRVDAADENAVRLFVKSQLYGEAPDYTTGTSDVIDGVTLSGRSLKIEKNTSFVLYAVDEKNNSSAVLLEITSLGEAPEPMAAQVLAEAGSEVRIYLLPPNMEGITNLTITNDANNDKKYDTELETDDTSMFHGMYYLPVTKNGKVNVLYSYEYDGVIYKGQLAVNVNSIDTEPAELVKDEKGRTVLWSANYDSSGMRYTNQQITAQMQFNKPLKDVKLFVADSNEDVTNTVPGLTVTWLENLVTVIYDINVPKLRMTVTASVNGLPTTVDLPQIETIDIGEPIVSGKVEYTPDHRKALVTITSDEEGVLQQTGRKSETVSEEGAAKYIFEETIKENGTYTFTVVDKAGNTGVATVQVKEIVGELKLELSTGGNETSIIDPKTYEAEVGDTLYVRVNRGASVSMNDTVLGNVNANEWRQIQIGEDAAGLYPCIAAEDAYGNTAKVQLLYIPLGDRKSPIIIVKERLVSASRGDSEAAVKALLRENVSVSDETTLEDKLIVDIDCDLTSQNSRIPVTYTVTDEAGNQAFGKCMLRLYTGNESAVNVNGTKVQWDDTLMVSKGKQVIEIVTDGEPYRFDYKAGVKTAAQLKNGSEALTSGYVSEKTQQFEVELNDPGFYTFLITTQGRNEYRFVLYAEE